MCIFVLTASTLMSSAIICLDNQPVLGLPLELQEKQQEEKRMDKISSALNSQVGGSHYKDRKIQPVQYIEANELQFLEGCVVKRVTRHDKPTGKGRQDIEKAIHELQLLLELRYPEVEV